MYGSIKNHLQAQLAGIKEEGLFKDIWRRVLALHRTSSVSRMIGSHEAAGMSYEMFPEGGLPRWPHESDG